MITVTDDEPVERSLVTVAGIVGHDRNARQLSSSSSHLPTAGGS